VGQQGHYKIGVYVLPKKLDEEVARLHLEKIGVKLTTLLPSRRIIWACRWKGLTRRRITVPGGVSRRGAPWLASAASERRRCWRSSAHHRSGSGPGIASSRAGEYRTAADANCVRLAIRKNDNALPSMLQGFGEF
jgi:hypothetical protein